ncbi:Inner membrane protein, KefB/KefC family [hydrothermal vent metagenome]|uniref:Inner membrane protein, KefB/KefC family n=1 Tax=hydrothermal vent metagenome TaxID=652676 RepID=A0A3B0WZB7_9ZZZZ
MDYQNIIFEFVLIFAGAAIFSTIFLYLKQPVILAYIAFGIIAGPLALGFIERPEHIEKLSHVGVILLLYLLGMNLKPDRLYQLFSKTAVVTLLTSVVFFVTVTLTALAFGFEVIESVIIGAALMFSSTIVSLKLIPTTALHHRHTGEMMISVLLMQDIIAIVLIVILTGGQGESVGLTVLFLFMKLIVLSVVAFVIVKYVVNNLLLRFDTIQEYTFLLALGWGLLGAGVAELIGLSYEMGAFIAGVAFASSPISLVIAEHLKPLRDFFLILFFFSIGAQFNFLVTQDVLLAGFVIAILIMLVKPFVFKKGFQFIGEDENFSAELGSRLGQGSEFSLLVAYSALAGGWIDSHTSYLIQMVVIITFILSTYWVVYRYRTPISSTEKNRMD